MPGILTLIGTMLALAGIVYIAKGDKERNTQAENNDGKVEGDPVVNEISVLAGIGKPFRKEVSQNKSAANLSNSAR